MNFLLNSITSPPKSLKLTVYTIHTLPCKCLEQTNTYLFICLFVSFLFTICSDSFVGQIGGFSNAKHRQNPVSF